MEINFLDTYAVPTIVGICTCVGFVIKNSLPIPDKYIPLIMAILGIVLNIWINSSINPNILLEGIFSGLASTGVHQSFKQLISKEKEGDK